MINIRSGINRHLTSPPFNRVINIRQNEEFLIANKTFSGRLRKIKESSKCVKILQRILLPPKTWKKHTEIA